jgi:uncharacterized membrane protein HdeD (DUF308 family)
MQRQAPMNALVKNWWLVVLRGALAGLFGLSILSWPNLTLGGLVGLFGAYAIVDGVCAVISALRAAARPAEGWPVMSEGLVSLVCGVLAFAWPWIPRHALHLIASWGVLTGLLELTGAARLPRSRASHWFLALGGLSSLSLAGLLFAVPHATHRDVIVVIAGYALVFGALLCLAGLRLRALRSAPDAQGSDPDVAKLRARS